VTSRILSKMSAPPLVYSLPPSSSGRTRGEEIGEDEAAPGRAQAREPGDAVPEVQERARQRVEVLHDLLLASCSIVERRKRTPASLSAGTISSRCAPVADEDRLAAEAPGRYNDLLRFLLAVVAAVPVTAAPGSALSCGEAGRYGTAPDVWSSCAGARAGNDSLNHFTSLLRAAVGAELDRLELHRPEPGVLRVQEERHFGFAEAVNRLHRVADEDSVRPSPSCSRKSAW